VFSGPTGGVLSSPPQLQLQQQQQQQPAAVATIAFFPNL